MVMKKILVTGAAGFVGYAFTKELLAAGYCVLGIDNLNDYYDVSLKRARLAELEGQSGFTFQQVDLADRDAMAAMFESEKPQIVVNLAAQAGVRYSLDHPHAYVDSNLQGFVNVLEGCRHVGVEHLIFASSSSVYGANTKVPFAVSDNVDHPISLYAATKKAGELMAHSYAHLYGIPCTGLRFFTVYGPWGRPDMAYFKFTKAIYEGKAIDVYNDGDMMRDFTYIDDITAAMMKLLDHVPAGDASWDAKNPDPSFSNAPYRLYNIGHNHPEKLMDMIHILEEETGRMAEKNFMPMQPGDVYATYADVKGLEEVIGFKPEMSLAEGLKRFVSWYKGYYGFSENTKSVAGHKN
ncbi:MAG: NAD-dependent epimerase [Rhodospirillales bacterium]|nr:NAD-dependent epimerase [Alphaproteobacteria bacterium]MCB9981725.1 NAD-dependent epimerase [Rhodospirillales bacterium]